VTRAREWLAGLVLAGCGLLLGLVLLEVGVRWLHLVPDRFWEPDPLLGVRLIPGHRGWWTQEDREFLVPVQVNREGLRDVEHTFAKPAGVFRILVLGDSFVEAMHVPLDDTFARVLQRRLDAGGRGHVEVVSAGVSGYGTASELLYFEREGKRYQPDLVLLAFYPGNDVMNNSPTLEDTLKPVYAADGRLQKVVGPPPPRLRGWRWLVGQSAAYHYFRQVLLLRHPRLAHTLVAHGLLSRAAIRAAPERDGVPVAYGVYAVPLSAEWEGAWRHTERLLADLQGAVQASGARLAVAVLSTREQVYPAWWHEVLQAHPAMRGRQWDLDAPQHRLAVWCAAHQVPHVLLGPVFQQAARTGAPPLHYHHDGHWTVAGHHLAAVTLQQFLEQHHLVSPPGDAGSVTEEEQR
jgi:SGNH hydrolase-like domain, acetyltransferase AlgX